jgi:hypothetical protein
MVDVSVFTIVPRRIVSWGIEGNPLSGGRTVAGSVEGGG